MAADIPQSLKNWSATPDGNAPTQSTLIGGNLDDNLRNIQAAVRADLASRDTIASASTTDIGSKDAGSLSVTGTTTIVSFGTAEAGIRKLLTFAGALTLTHNATSMILPNGGSNITTAAGDVALAESLGVGNWKVLVYQRANGNNVANAATFGDGTVSAPGIAFTSDTNTGIYRVGADSIGVATGGVQAMSLISSRATFPGEVSVGGRLSVSGDVYIDLGASIGGESSIYIKAEQNTSGSGYGGGVTIESGAGWNAGSINFKPGVGSVTTRYGTVDFWNSDRNSPALRVNGYGGHLSVVDGDSGGGPQNTPASTSGGGTSPSIVGSDNACKITLGTSPGSTAIVLTFAKAFASAPIAIAQYQSAHLDLRAVATTTTLTITPASSMTAGHVIDVIVIGRETI